MRITGIGERIFLSPPHIGQRESALVRDALDSNFIAPVGPMLDAFEARLQEATGFESVAAVASGTAAIDLALDIVGIGRGDRVIVPSFTFMGSVGPIVHKGAEPIFIDCAPGSWLLDLDLLRQALASLKAQGRPAKAVISVDMYGDPVDTAAVADMCAEFDAAYISDSAESVGSHRAGRHAGKGADIACFSFNGNKIITTSGGGAIASDDPALVARARHLATQAREPFPYYEHKDVGYNYRLSNILAAIGLAQLESLETRVAQRQRLAEKYQEVLGCLPGVRFLRDLPEASGNRWLTTLLLDAETGILPETIRLALEEENIEARPVWKPMHLQPVFRNATMIGGPVCEAYFAQGLCLPSGPHVTDTVINRIADVFRQSMKKRA